MLQRLLEARDSGRLCSSTWTPLKRSLRSASSTRNFSIELSDRPLRCDGGFERDLLFAQGALLLGDVLGQRAQAQREKPALTCVARP